VFLLKTSIKHKSEFLAFKNAILFYYRQLISSKYIFIFFRNKNKSIFVSLKKVKQKQKLMAIIENKFGKYTRDLQDLELVS
jgi:hypothetical protein